MSWIVKFLSSVTIMQDLLEVIKNFIQAAFIDSEIKVLLTNLHNMAAKKKKKSYKCT